MFILSFILIKSVIPNWKTTLLIILQILQGGMMVPHYNSKATTIVLVVEGRGRFEMGCPHLSSRWSQESQREEEEESSGELQKISANLSPGDVFISRQVNLLPL